MIHAYAAFKRGVPDAVEVFVRAPRLVFSIVVVGELFSGFALGNRESVNRQEFADLLALPHVSLIGLDLDTAKCYANVFRDLRQAGTPVPTK